MVGSSVTNIGELGSGVPELSTLVKLSVIACPARVNLKAVCLSGRGWDIADGGVTDSSEFCGGVQWLILVMLLIVA